MLHGNCSSDGHKALEALCFHISSMSKSGVDRAQVFPVQKQRAHRRESTDQGRLRTRNVVPVFKQLIIA